MEQVDAFIKNILVVDESYAVEYLKYMKKWVSDPKMEEYVLIRLNPIMIKIIRYTQKISSVGIDTDKLDVYQLIFEIFEVFSTMEDWMLEVEENTLFDI